ncbi:hypothetical protein OEZ85_001932 [Tetradesmus obliquus]|uniref:NB-ARC domain-containing protein n=1 Tax=Tetradesmus obliquus TaxID=3088 RepID=A0ABY8U219_TETOB|nr:hypothetical protein OEZ85_001932 [Tetradesmus obliquus]
MDVGAEHVELELRRIMEDHSVPTPVLLVIDNVPEGDSGIGDLLPANLQDCLADGSRVLFTSRNQAAQGLRLKAYKYHVGCLELEASKKVLLAGRVPLDDTQLETALEFCQGLPLALTLLNRALLAEDDLTSLALLIGRLKSHGTFSVSKEDQLVKALSFSVDCLSQDLQTAWLNLAWMYSRHRFDNRLQLQCLFGEHTLRTLEDRSLIALRYIGWKSATTREAMVEVVLHDLLLRMAEGMTGLQGKNPCLRLDPKSQSISLSPALKAKCVGLMAPGASCSISNLPLLGQLRVLRVHRVDDLAAVLAQGTNLQWLEVAKAGCCSLQALPDSITQLKQLQVVSLSGCSSISRLPAGFANLPLKYFDNSTGRSTVDKPPDSSSQARSGWWNLLPPYFRDLWWKDKENKSVSYGRPSSLQDYSAT